MNTTAELTDWLRDAYAMEKAMETALKKLTDHPATHPTLREQAERHCTETRHHSEAIAICLKRLGSDASSLKTAAAQGMDFMRGTSSTLARDERLKDVLTVLVTEHFEIACHTILRTGAVRLGRHEIVDICDEILVEEKRMARWLQINLPQIIAAYMAPEPESETVKEEETDRVKESHEKRMAQWEFIQLAQTATLFGGQTSGTAFALN